MAQPQNEQKKPTAPKTNRRKLDIWNKLAVKYPIYILSWMYICILCTCEYY